MMVPKIDFSKRGWARVWMFTILGTALCIGVAFAVDSFEVSSGTWRLSDSALNNAIIPGLLAPPLFFFLLAKLRELAIAHHELLHFAATDSLTQCLNRRAFTALVDGYLARTAEREEELRGALLVIDIDHFKTINDDFGHASGDVALAAVAGAIKAAVRDLDLVGRLGGEEFGVFLPGVTEAATQQLSERIRLAISQTAFAPLGLPHGMSASVGGAWFISRASFSELFRLADERLYAAKRGGRNRVEVSHFRPAAPEALQLH